MNQSKYEQKAKETIKFCRKKKVKYRLIGVSVILITVITALVTLEIFKDYKLYILLAMLVIPSIEAEITVSKVRAITRYERQQIELIENMKTIEELKHI